jgi:hypothetical protein
MQFKRFLNIDIYILIPTQKFDITLLDSTLFYFLNFDNVSRCTVCFYFTPHGKIISYVRSGDLGDHTTEPR